MRIIFIQSQKLKKLLITYEFEAENKFVLDFAQLFVVLNFFYHKLMIILNFKRFKKSVECALSRN